MALLSGLIGGGPVFDPLLWVTVGCAEASRSFGILWTLCASFAPGFGGPIGSCEVDSCLGTRGPVFRPWFGGERSSIKHIIALDYNGVHIIIILYQCLAYIVSFRLYIVH